MVHSVFGPLSRTALVLLSALGLPGLAPGAPSPPDFRDEWGRPVELDDFRGHPVVVAMAYTTCRRACPATVAALQRLARTIADQGETVAFVIVGFDPEKDDPQAWRDYRANHGIEGDHWHFLAGTEPSTRRFGRQFGFSYWRIDEHVMHEQRVVVLDGRGSFVGSDDRLSQTHLLELVQKAEGAGRASSATTKA